MEYPLAHDDSGNPIDVPANAAGWLVRRHAGGRGRPAAVYDGDGRPLVVPLESTAAELRGHGCKPGMYRLDAVDAGRRTLEAVAYTEVSFDGAVDEVDGAKVPSGSDAAVAACQGAGVLTTRGAAKLTTRMWSSAVGLVPSTVPGARGGQTDHG